MRRVPRGIRVACRSRRRSLLRGIPRHPALRFECRPPRDDERNVGADFALGGGSGTRPRPGVGVRRWPSAARLRRRVASKGGGMGGAANLRPQRHELPDRDASLSGSEAPAEAGAYTPARSNHRWWVGGRSGSPAVGWNGQERSRIELFEPQSIGGASRVDRRR
jgi:hypothetical protein